MGRVIVRRSRSVGVLSGRRSLLIGRSWFVCFVDVSFLVKRCLFGISSF